MAISCPLCKSTIIRKAYLCKDMVVYKCTKCSMNFQDHQSSLCRNRELIDKIYSDYMLHLKPHFILNEERLGRLKGIFPSGLKDLKILEIGVGSGALATLLMKEGALYQGVEPLDVLYKNILLNLPQLKEFVHNKYYHPDDYPKDHFDLVIIVDTLEHIPNSIDFLGLVRGSLKKGGILYIEVPNEAGLVYKARFKERFGMYCGYPTNPDHISLFTRQTLGKGLDLSGYKLNSLSQATIWGNLSRMKMVFKKENALWLQAACAFFRLTKIDLLLQQGTLVAVSQK